MKVVNLNVIVLRKVSVEEVDVLMDVSRQLLDIIGEDQRVR